MRLIDADVLSTQLRGLRDNHESYGLKEDACGRDIFHVSLGINMAIGAVESALAVRSEWIPITNGRPGNWCGICHGYAPDYQVGGEHLTDYCPHCGAKMK